MNFWSLEQLDLEDPLNVEIWKRSPVEQEQIQPYKGDWLLGEIGAQQAMRFPYRLPWVPDPVGYDWNKSNAVLVVGSAYGPFIGGDGRSHEIAPAEYAAETCKEFSKVFFTRVIQCRLYYSRVAEIVLPVVDSCRSIALFDLCRIAFVRRAQGRDEGEDSVTNAAPELFTSYIESPMANDWLWRRVTGSESSTLLALGTIAEHGILRLFTRNLRDVRISDSADPTIVYKCKSGDHKWPARYANVRRKLKHRMEAASPPFWQVTGVTAAGVKRMWRVAVVPHPTGARGFTNSSYSTEALRMAYRA